MKKTNGLLFTVLGGICFSRAIEFSYAVITGAYDLSSAFKNTVLAISYILFLLYTVLIPIALGAIFATIGFKRMKNNNQSAWKYTLWLVGSCSVAYVLGTLLHYAFINLLYGLPALIFY